MSESKIKLIFKKIPAIASNPIDAFTLVWRRMFPFGIIPKDPEAYRIGSWSYGSIPRVPLITIFPGIESSDVRILNAFDRDPITSMDVQEVIALCSVLKFRNAKNILEIGTFDGNTTLNMAANTADESKILTLDLPPDWNGKYELEIPGLYVNVTARDGIGKQYKAMPQFSPKITQAYGDSASIDWSKLPGPFDAVFIDGCHHYKYVKSDTENALKYLKPGGTLFWHDYGMIEDVSKVVDETVKNLGMKVSVIRGTRIAVGVKN